MQQKGAGRPSDGEHLDGVGRTEGRRGKERRGEKTEEKQDDVGAAPQRWWEEDGPEKVVATNSQCWGLEMHQPQPPRPQSQRARGPDENGELECGGSSERVRKMKRVGTKQGAPEPAGWSCGEEPVPCNLPRSGFKARPLTHLSHVTLGERFNDVQH